MTVNEIIALCNAGYNHEQIMQLAQAQQMERAAQVQPAPVQQPAQPDPYAAIMAELLGLKQAVQAGNMLQTQQPAVPMTADDIIANIIAPKPRKED